MKNYLSFGGGVNSVAMMLYLLDEGWDFEAVFVNHGTDWPETYEYLDMFQNWLVKRGFNQITVLKTNIQGCTTLYDYCWMYKMVPSIMQRWCTNKFKIRVMYQYYQKPCFVLIGFDFDEIKRVKISNNKGTENRYPLIEAEFTRNGCIEIIKTHGLPIPIKSGCFICPYQRGSQWKELRYRHPELFCKAEQLEKRNMEYQKIQGKKPLFLNQSPKASLRVIVNETQGKLFKQDEYPPCHCML